MTQTGENLMKLNPLTGEKSIVSIKLTTLAIYPLIGFDLIHISPVPKCANTLRPFRFLVFDDGNFILSQIIFVKMLQIHGNL